MGKRSSFERKPRDFYPTPKDAVWPLAAHLPVTMSYCEPCAGDGALVHHLDDIGDDIGLNWRLTRALDVEPRASWIRERDALQLVENDLEGADVIITNPPWNRNLLHPMIMHFTHLRPTWLLFDADWAHTKQAMPFLPLLREIVSVGRVKWIPGSKNTGKDNCCWYLFDRPGPDDGPTIFHGRQG